MLKLLSFFCIIFFSFFSFSQEICNNGIDDDLDGLIDLNDSDCDCASSGGTVVGVIPNPSFEDNSCCPETITTSTPIPCISNWVAGTNATPDYYNCTYTESIFNSVDSPLPGSGTGYMGFFGGSSNTEYIGTCLNTPMTAGTPYTIELNTAAGEPSFGSPTNPFTLTLFGSPDCGDLPWSTGIDDCADGFGSWETLGMVTVNYLTLGAWQTVQITFTPTIDINAICLGPPCGMTGSLSYYYIDDLTLTTTGSTLTGTIAESGTWCDGDLTLTSNSPSAGGLWQWYNNGIALVGETSPILDVMVDGTGNYTAVYSLGDDCIQINHTVTIPPSPVADFTDVINCATATFTDASVVGLPSIITNYDWDFGDGNVSNNQNPVNLYTNSGSYTVNLTVTDDLGCTHTTSQIINVPQSSGPTASNPLALGVDGSIQCVSDIPLPDPTVVTDETGTGVVEIEWVSDVSDGNSCPETITRTYSVTDDCSTINVTQTIIVNDITAPIANVTSNLSVDCNAGIPVANISDFNATDNCGVPTILFVSDISDGNSCPEIITRNYKITDLCDNSINVTQTITIDDITPPVASNPIAISVMCTSDVPAPDPTVVTDESDNCGIPVVAFVSDSQSGMNCDNETIIRTYSITDACGNYSMVTQQINIDAFYPLVTAGQDITGCEGVSIKLEAGNPNNANLLWMPGNISDGSSFVPDLGTTSYTVTAEICNGQCISTDNLLVDIYPVPNVLFSGDELSGCVDHDVTFTNLTDNIYDCYWDLGDGTINDNCDDFTHTYTYPGLFDVTLILTTDHGCVDSITYLNYIDVSPAPIANFTFYPNVVTSYNNEISFNNLSDLSDSYLWTFDPVSVTSTETNPSNTFNYESGKVYTITLEAINDLGCSDLYSTTIAAEDELIYYVPNAFTPDGDEFNNMFSPVFTSGYNIYSYHLTIFNRWGEIIFESYNASEGWDGKYGGNGLAQDGVYIWKIEFAESQNGNKYSETGHVTLLR